MKLWLYGLMFLLVSCGNEDFSPTYSESVCVPAQELYFIEALNQSSETPASCCQESGLVSCCFGGRYVCADGKSDIGCGCPLN